MEVFIKSIKIFKRIFHQRRRVRAQWLVHYSVCTFIQPLRRSATLSPLTRITFRQKSVLFYLGFKSTLKANLSRLFPVPVKQLWKLPLVTLSQLRVIIIYNL